MGGSPSVYPVIQVPRYISSSASARIVLKLYWHGQLIQLEVLVNHVKADFKVWPVVTELTSEAKKKHHYTGVQQSLPQTRTRVCTEVLGLIWLSGRFLPRWVPPKGQGVCGVLPAPYRELLSKHCQNPQLLTYSSFWQCTLLLEVVK